MTASSGGKQHPPPAVTGSRKLPFQPAMRPAVGRLGIDISKATMDNYRNQKKEAEGNETATEERTREGRKTIVKGGGETRGKRPTPK